MSKIAVVASLLLACGCNALRPDLMTHANAGPSDFDEQCERKVPGTKALTIKRVYSWPHHARKAVTACACRDSSKVVARKSDGHVPSGPKRGSFKWSAFAFGDGYVCMPEDEQLSRKASASMDWAMNIEGRGMYGLEQAGDALRYAADVLGSKVPSPTRPMDFRKFDCADRPHRRKELDNACEAAVSVFDGSNPVSNSENVLHAIVGLEAFMSISGYDAAVAALSETARVVKLNENWYKGSAQAKQLEQKKALEAHASLKKFLADLKPKVNSFRGRAATA